MDSAINLLKINPVEQYTPPKYPTYADTHNSPNLLNKLPSRWQQKTAVIACIGLMGASALIGCSSRDNQDSNGGYSGYSNFDISVRQHRGGRGSAFYVVYLTEQEALGIIRAEAARAGLHFNDEPPPYHVDYNDLIVGLDLFNEDKGIAIAHIDSYDSNRPFSAREARLAEIIESAFLQQGRDINIGVIYSPIRDIGRDTPRNITIRRARRGLRIDFTAQVRNYIELLREQGLLE